MLGATEKARVRGAILVLFLLCAAPARAQAPPPANRPAGVSYSHFKDTPQGKVLDAMMDGSEAKSLPGGLVSVKDFQLKGLRDGQTNQVQVIAQAPECEIDLRNGQESARDPGPIQIFTPTTNLFVQGVGFFCAESNQVLVISNQVETRVVESLLRSGVFPAPKTGAPAEAGQLLKIFSDRGEFYYQSNLVHYAGNVRAADPQLQMLSPFLSVQFASNQAVESILAWKGVTVVLTNKGTATGATGSYFATNGTELLVLDGDAQWHNGPQEAKAAKFTYDPDRHFLTGEDQVFARWPNDATNPAAPATFRELFADHSTLQMSTNGQTVDAMSAWGNVILVNQADHSRANADRADYNRTNDLMELTGDADWRNDEMEVQGERLSLASSNKIFHAENHARFKAHLAGQPTNRWLDISSDDLVHQPLDARTNLATFLGHVHAQLLEEGQPQDTLTCQRLLVYLDSSNQVETVVARGDVHGETAADAAGVRKTITCGALTARRSPATGLWRSVMAEENVEMNLTGSGPEAATNRLTAAIVTAYFSSVTNQIENVVATGNVDFDQDKNGTIIHATGDHAVYDLAPAEQIVLTGHPAARKDTTVITGADRLVWDVKSGGFIAAGLYHITATNNLATSGEAPPPPPP
jgi:lipopolysaccharide export system protein LptA